jgi:hypothetical protein
MSLLKRTPSAAQVAAARANGAKSKGPVSPQGKRNSSANARRYPDYFDLINTLTPAQRRFEAEIISDYSTACPHLGPVEEHLIETIARERVLQLHYARVACIIYEAGDPCSRLISCLSRLQGASHRNLTAAVKTLARCEAAAKRLKLSERTVQSDEKKQKLPKNKPICVSNMPPFDTKIGFSDTEIGVFAPNPHLKTSTNQA